MHKESLLNNSDDEVELENGSDLRLSLRSVEDVAQVDEYQGR